jgi:RNA polymerase sigma-70 factor (ECF subfamily)
LLVYAVRRLPPPTHAMMLPQARIELSSADGEHPLPLTIANDGAFEELFREHHAKLCGFVYRIVGSRAVAEELVQEVFLYLWEHRATWSAHTSIRTYLYAAARNGALNYLRREKLDFPVRQGDPDIVERFTQAPQPADQELVMSELERDVKRAIDRLPERCRLVYTLSRQQHLSYLEIATVLEISPKTVEVQMGRAFKALRKYLAGYLH